MKDFKHITNSMLSAGLDAMRRDMRGDKLIEDFPTRERIKIVTAIYLSMLDAAERGEIVPE